MARSQQLKGKAVLVTGASCGLGAECAKHFARAGAIVLMVARRKSRLLRNMRAIRSCGGEANCVVADLTRLRDLDRVHETATKYFGQIDILINNAAAYEEGNSLIETSINEWSRMMNTNLRAPYLLCRAFLPRMLDRGYGRVINITSATSHLSGVGPFRISKVALEVLTAVLADEVEGSGVTVTGFNPNWMKSETSLSGRSPRGAARAIIELVQQRPTLLNGKIYDLRWEGRKYQICKRLHGRGQYGLPPES
jgi:NAD(P)-dependent dehydrogenase (short-subunit alcohol dehydrogenase family)